MVLDIIPPPPLQKKKRKLAVLVKVNEKCHAKGLESDSGPVSHNVALPWE